MTEVDATIQAPPGLSIRGSGRGFFVFKEEGATVPATERNSYDSLQRNCGALRRNRYKPSRACVRVRAKTKRLRQET